MLQWGITTLRQLNIPVSESICPVVQLAKAHSFFGQCCRKGCGTNKTTYDFLIRISIFTLGNSEKSIRNTILHELLHTCPGGHGHKGKWAEYAAIVNRALGYHIQRKGGDKTDSDTKNLRGNSTISTKHTKTYVVVCPQCGARWIRHRRSPFTEHPERWRCGVCKIGLVRK